MLKQLLIIISIFGISLCQIQRGGTPTYFDQRIDQINFIRVNQDNIDAKMYFIPNCFMIDRIRNG